MNYDSNYQIVIRSSNERTEKLCTKLTTDFFKTDRFTIIHEVPFSKALKTSFKIGINSHKKWLICIDADVLVSKKGLTSLLKKMQTVNKNIFEIQGKIIDQFFGGKRGGGIHIYRIELLPKALQLLSKDEVIRPENFVIMKMLENGFPYIQTEDIVGIHDFGQFYKDIYRKFIVHSKKHQSFIPSLKPFWLRMSKHNSDFKVAIIGLEDGTNKHKVSINIQEFPNSIKKIPSLKNFTEKEHLINLKFTTKDIDSFIKTFFSPVEYFNFLDIASKNGGHVPNKYIRWFQKKNNSLKRLCFKQKDLPL